MATRDHSTRTSPKQALLLIFLSILCGILLIEFPGRYLLPTPFKEFELLHFEPTDLREHVVEDSELGYRPNFGAHSFYDSRGINLSGSIHLDEGTTRILFLGDSVTRRGKLLQALDAAYFGNQWQFMNSGVEGYDVPQEVGYFLRYSSRVLPQRIVLTFHNNDLTYAPAHYRRSDKEMLWYFPGEPARVFDTRLYRLSFLYRHWFGHEFFRLLYSAIEKQRLLPDTEAALRTLKAWANDHGARLQIVLLPILSAPENWSKDEQNSRTHSIQLFRQLGIEYFDLIEPLREAIQHLPNLGENESEDTWHPNDAVAGYFGRHLKSKGIFDDLTIDQKD